MKSKIKISDIFAYIQGHLRYKIYYNPYLAWMMRTHIREQIDWRINEKMDKECYEKGSCKMCGCDTTALQMADKACPKPCYPKMMDKKEWEYQKSVEKLKKYKPTFNRCTGAVSYAPKDVQEQTENFPGIPSSLWRLPEQKLPNHPFMNIGVNDIEVNEPEIVKIVNTDSIKSFKYKVVMENYWQSKKVDFGFVKKNTNKEIQFQALPNIPEIVNIKADCGCTKTKYDPITRILKVTYKAGEIPKHLGNKNQTILKKITIQYKGGLTDVLEIAGTKTSF